MKIKSNIFVAANRKDAKLSRKSLHARVFSYLYFQNAAAFFLLTSVLNTTFKKLEAILAPRSTCVEKLET